MGPERDLQRRHAREHEPAARSPRLPRLCYGSTIGITGARSATAAGSARLTRATCSSARAATAGASTRSSPERRRATAWRARIDVVDAPGSAIYSMEVGARRARSTSATTRRSTASPEERSPEPRWEYPRRNARSPSPHGTRREVTDGHRSREAHHRDRAGWCSPCPGRRAKHPSRRRARAGSRRARWVGMSRVATDLAVEVERSTEPIVAWRSWALTGRSDGSRLLLRPVAGRAHPWRPREVATATCKRAGSSTRRPRSGAHAGSMPRRRSTSCGARSARRSGPRGTLGPRDRARARLPGAVRVSAALRLICQFCFWQRGPLGDGPTVVAFYPRDGLVPLCPTHLEAAHANGMPPKRLLAAGVVDQRLREAYAVDLLAI